MKIDPKKYPVLARSISLANDSFVSLVFVKDAEIEIFEEAGDEVEPTIEVFKKGEPISFDVLEESETEYKEVQFGDGSVAFGLPKSLFKKRN